jgi:nicotinamidase-related amidase
MTDIPACPFAFPLDRDRVALIVIDMQRDFIEPGGFGASLGNDVSLLSAIVPTVRRLLDGFRAAGLPVIHTRECHRPDLSDCPTAKRLRGAPSMRIGDAGPMGRILIAGEPGVAIVPDLVPLPGEIVIDKPGKGAFYGTDLGQQLANLGITQLIFAGVTRGLCADHDARGQ